MVRPGDLVCALGLAQSGGVRWQLMLGCCSPGGAAAPAVGPPCVTHPPRPRPLPGPGGAAAPAARRRRRAAAAADHAAPVQHCQCSDGRDSSAGGVGQVAMRAAWRDISCMCPARRPASRHAPRKHTGPSPGPATRPAPAQAVRLTELTAQLEARGLLDDVDLDLNLDEDAGACAN